MLTSEQIAQAKLETRHRIRDGHHEHDDCIRIAYEWLDAQVKTKTPNKRSGRPLKHIIERWAGRYVSTEDVELAAHLHPYVLGAYPYFNLSSKLVRPHQRRLKSIDQALTQHQNDPNTRTVYHSDEA